MRRSLIFVLLFVLCQTFPLKKTARRRVFDRYYEETRRREEKFSRERHLRRVRTRLPDEDYADRRDNLVVDDDERIEEEAFEAVMMAMAREVPSYSHRQTQNLVVQEAVEEDTPGVVDARRIDVELPADKAPEPATDAGVVLRFTHKAFQFAATNIKKLFGEELEGRPLASISRVLMRLNVSLLNAKLTDISMPDITYEALSGNSIQVKSQGGFAKVLGNYHAVYKTVREGHFEVKLESFVTDLKIKFIKTFAGRMKLVDMHCAASVHSSEVRLSPKLHEQIVDGLRVAVADEVAARICDGIHDYLNRIEERLTNFVAHSPITAQVNSMPSELTMDVSMTDDALLTRKYLDVPLSGAFVVSGQKNVHFNTAAIAKAESDDEKMVYIYVSDFTINSLFHQLSLLGDFRVNLHQISEIKRGLRLNCAADERCIGKLLHNPADYSPNSGRMEARLRSPPQVVLDEDGAHIGLDLTVDVSLKGSGEQESLRSVLLAFNLKLRLHVDGISIEKTTESDGDTEHRFQINASVSISELDVTEAIAYVASLNAFSMELPTFIARLKNALENVLRKNLHSIIPLSVSPLIGVNSVSGVFRSRTLVLGFDMDIHEKLFEHFSLLA